MIFNISSHVLYYMYFNEIKLKWYKIILKIFKNLEHIIKILIFNLPKNNLLYFNLIITVSINIFRIFSIIDIKNKKKRGEKNKIENGK